MARLLAVRIPVSWADYGFDSPWDAGGTVLAEGPHAWAWADAPPSLPIADFSQPADASPSPGWAVDHVVLLVPDVEAAVAELQDAGADLRLRMVARGRPTAFFRVGTVLEVMETNVPQPRLYGVALVTGQPLTEIAAHWRDAGHDVSDPRPAIQEGRQILTVRDAGAGLAIMSPEQARA